MTSHIAVLKGGLSSEREISLLSGKAVAEALHELGYKVSEIDAGYDVATVLFDVKPDIVFNALHGTYGEDGCIQGLLEFMKIPYTHSGVLASALAMDKPTAKVLFTEARIKSPSGKLISREELLSNLSLPELCKNSRAISSKYTEMPRPYVIKPPAEGSSLGVAIVKAGDDINRILRDITHNGELLVEEYIAGREVSVAVMDAKALGVVEIRPKDGFYDYRNKYTSNMTEYIVPAPVKKEIYDKAMRMAEKAHEILGCRGVSRSDFRLSNEGELYLLEVNTHPGMTEISLVPKIAENAGISFQELVESLVQSARLDNDKSFA